MSIEDHKVKLKEGEEHCETCEGLGFRFGCRAPDDCEEWDCEDCDCTGIKSTESEKLCTH